jgi:hypothetical protein
LERTIFSTPNELRCHAREKHPDRLPTEDKEMEGFWSQFEAESGLKRWETPSRLQGAPTPSLQYSLALNPVERVTCWKAAATF